MEQSDKHESGGTLTAERPPANGAAELQAVVDRIRQRVARLERRAPAAGADGASAPQPVQDADSIARQVSQRLSQLRQERPGEAPRPLLDAINARRKALDQCADALERRAKAVEQGANELATRAAQLRGERDRLDGDRAEFETRRRELDLRLETLAARQRDYQEAQARLETELAELEAREARVAACRANVGDRVGELARQRDAVARRRRALEQHEHNARQRAAVIEATQRELAEREAHFEAAHTALEREQHGLRARQAELGQERARLAEERAALASARDDIAFEHSRIADRRNRLGALRTRLDNRVVRLRTRRDRIAGREREIEQRIDRSLERLADLQAQDQRLDRLDAELRDRRDRLEDRGRDLDEVEHELAEREQAASATRARLAATEERQAQLAERIAELRRRRDALARRERDVAARTTALDARSAALDARAGELAASEEQLDARAQSFAGREREVTGREQEIESRQEALGDRTAELDRRLDTLNERAERSAAVEQELDELDRRLGERKASLSETQAEIESQAAALEERAAEVDTFASYVGDRERTLVDSERRLATAEQEVAAQRADLERRQAELAEQLAACARELESSAGARRDAARTAAEFEQRSGALDEQARRLAGRELHFAALAAGLRERQELLARAQADMAAGEVQLSESRAALDAEQRELDGQRAEVAEQRRRFEAERENWLQSRREAIQPDPDDAQAAGDRLWEQLADLRGGGQALRCEITSSLADWAIARDELMRLAGEIAALADHEHELPDADESATRLARREREIAAQTERVARLEDERGALEQRRIDAERLYSQAMLASDRAQRARAELDHLRDELAAQRAELQRATLQLEVDRSQLADIRARLEQDRTDVSEAAERVSAQARAYGLEISPDGRRVTAKARMVRGLWLRTAAASLVFGGAAAWGWLALHPAQTRSELVVRGRHAGGVWDQAITLGDPEHADRWLSGPDIQTWRAALRGQRAVVLPDAVAQTITLRLDGDAHRAGDDALLASLAQRFAATAPAGQPPVETTEEWIAWSDQLELLEHEHDVWLAELAGIETRLAAIPSSDAYSAVTGEIVALQRTLDGLRGDVAAARERSAALAREPRPTGVVTPEALEAARTADPIYQEDLKEFDAQSKLFRRELGVAMVLVGEPVRGLRESLKGFEQLTNEQLELNPPEAVRFALEELLVAINKFDRSLATFLQEWDTRIAELERMSPAEQVLALFDNQRDAHEAAKEALARGNQAIEELRTRLRQLVEQPSVGTRGMVVTSVLRGELARLEERAAAIAETVSGLDPVVNLQLDASQRQLRGIRSRIQKRAGILATELQEEADRLAAADYDQTLAEARQRVRTLEQQRDEQVTALLAKIDAQRSIERRDDDIKALETQRGAVLAAVQRLEQERAALLACEPEGVTPEFEVGAIAHTPLAGPDRVAHAGYAGGAACGGVWLLGGLMAAGGPRRRQVQG